MPAAFVSVNIFMIKNVRGGSSNFVMGEAMQETSSLDMFDMQDDIAISASRCCSHNILVERKRDKSNHEQEIHHSTYGTHRFRSIKGQQMIPAIEDWSIHTSPVSWLWPYPSLSNRPL